MRYKRTSRKDLDNICTGIKYEQNFLIDDKILLDVVSKDYRDIFIRMRPKSKNFLGKIKEHFTTREDLRCYNLTLIE